MQDKQATPVIKWVGGKTRLLPELMARVPAKFNRYYEPFAGGAALFLAMAPNLADGSVLGDMNDDLMNMYRVMRRDTYYVEAVIYRLLKLFARHSPERYFVVRALWNDPNASWSDIDRAATFIYLNKTCFNGLWRVNLSGHFNVGLGNYVTFNIDERNIHAVSRHLRRAQLRRGEYRDTCSDTERGDFVYFDPPYDPVTKTANFTGYTASQFGETQQRELAAFARGLVSRGRMVMISNSDTALIRKLYRGFNIRRVFRSGTINSDPSKRSDVVELLITSGYT